MSGSWSGFSEDDIRKLKSNNGVLKENGRSHNLKIKKRTQINISKAKINQQLKNSEVVDPISDDAKLSKNEKTCKNAEVSNEVAALNSEENTQIDIKPSNNSLTLNTSKIEKKVIDLDEFQARQKLIEEQNRKRKELLTKALADRTKQTEDEARRLKEIQNEFKKLDAILSSDVAILRHQIELASLDFMEAQKRYNKVEKEFLDAKLVLHQRLEKKEMLTEHLCAIIEKNEERKAEKLNELMNRLNLDNKTEINNVDEKDEVKQNTVQPEESVTNET